jgi:hypothetical protein
VAELRARGLQVSDDLTKAECRRLEKALNAPKVYSVDEATEIYRRYAHLKGWSTIEKVIREKVEDWRFSKDGAVQLAIDFHETGIDNAKYIGMDAESRAADPSDRIVQAAMNAAGIEFANEDGTSRMEIVDRCVPYEQLVLRREPDNPHDANAIAIFRKSGEQIGYVRRRTAADIVERAKNGYGHYAFFREKAQRYGEDEARLILVVSRPGVTNPELVEYVRRWTKPITVPGNSD